MPTTDDATLTDWIEHALNECGDIISLLDNDGHSQGKSLAIGLRATLLTMKGHFGDEADTGFSSGEAGSYTAPTWRAEPPTEEGRYWMQERYNGEWLNPEIVYVKRCYGHLKTRDLKGAPSVKTMNARWAGPILEPTPKGEAEGAV